MIRIKDRQTELFKFVIPQAVSIVIILIRMVVRPDKSVTIITVTPKRIPMVSRASMRTITYTTAKEYLLIVRAETSLKKNERKMVISCESS